MASREPSLDREQLLDLLAAANRAVRSDPCGNETYERLYALEQWMREFDAAHPSTNNLSISLPEQRTAREKEITHELVQDERLLASIDDLLDEMSRRYQAILRRASIRQHHVDEIILPPTPGGQIATGSETGFEPKQPAERRRLLLQLLSAAELDEGVVDTDGITAPTMLRYESYHLIDIPTVGKQILVCDLHGEASFIIDEQQHISFYTAPNMNKGILSNMPGIHRIVFRSERQWCEDILRFLRPNPIIPPVRSRAYYSNAMYVMTDLQRYAEAANLESVDQLSTKSIMNYAQCMNGETVHGATYLASAGVAFGMAQNAVEAQSVRSAILKRLKIIAGYQVLPLSLEPSHFFDPLNIRADLMQFAKACGVQNALEIVTTYRGREGIITLDDGQQYSLQRYLRHAAVALGWATNTRNVSSLSETLRRLQIIAGYSVPEFAPRDSNYYQDSQNIRSDLGKFCEAADINDIMQLTTFSMPLLQIVCANGETVMGATYLRNAAIALGFGPKKGAATLTRLKQIAGFEVQEFTKMDSAYFIPANVIADLRAFAEAASLSSEEQISMSQHAISANLSNGEKLTLGSYLRRAAVALGLAEKTADNTGPKKAIDRLKLIAGVEMEQEFTKMDSGYFTPTNVIADLRAFAEAAGISSHEHISLSRQNAISANLSNGEKLTLGSYLRRAAVALGLAKNTTDNAAPRRALTSLKAIIESSLSSGELKNFR